MVKKVKSQSKLKEQAKPSIRNKELKEVENV